jgi:hypothetical protein
MAWRLLTKAAKVASSAFILRTLIRARLPADGKFLCAPNQRPASGSARHDAATTNRVGGKIFSHLYSHILERGCSSLASVATAALSIWIAPYPTDVARG